MSVWWVQQMRALADFYFNAQFPDGVIDYRHYRTHLTLEGQKIESTRQETDTISRMIYGFASAYLLTGEDRYLEAAEKGTEYLREHMRAIDADEEVVYWYHAMDVRGSRERKIFASQFGDDYDAIPAYEQIYALAGPVQTYRVTGDPRILRDAEMTINLFDKFFRDREKGGYFSHIDPLTFNPRDETLGQDQARKNWNSVGDHAPAYLINLWLATGEKKYADFLAYTADTIVEHFQEGLRAQPVCAGALPRGLEPRRDMELAAEPRRRRTQSEDRLEPDAHPSPASRRALYGPGEKDCRGHAGGWHGQPARRLV